MFISNHACVGHLNGKQNREAISETRPAAVKVAQLGSIGSVAVGSRHYCTCHLVLNVVPCKRRDILEAG
jgi:hypothetical protein